MARIGLKAAETRKSAGLPLNSPFAYRSSHDLKHGTGEKRGGGGGPLIAPRILTRCRSSSFYYEPVVDSRFSRAIEGSLDEEECAAPSPLPPAPATATRRGVLLAGVARAFRCPVSDYTVILNTRSVSRGLDEGMGGRVGGRQGGNGADVDATTSTRGS